MSEPPDIELDVALEHRTAVRRSATYIGAFVLAGRVVERVAAFGQVLVVAAVFGTGYEADLYFIASVAPLLLGFVLGDALAAAVLPLLVRLPPARRAEVAATGFWVSLVSLLVVTVVYATVATAVALVARPAGGGPAAWLAFATTIVTLGLSGYLAALLLELERYVWPPFRLAAASVAGLGFTVLAAALFDGIVPLAIAAAGGYLVALLLMLVELRRAVGGALLLRPSRAGLLELLGTWRNLGAAVVSGFIGGQVFVVLERLFAASAGVGAVSTIAYARGVALAPNITAQGIAGGIYPGMVRSHEAGDRQDVGERFLRGLRLTIFLAIVMAAFLALYAFNVAAFVFERGEFGSETVGPVAAALVAFTPALVGNMLMILAARVFYAIDFFRGTILALGVALALYVPLAFVLRHAFGATGLAAAFGIAELVAGVVSVALIVRSLSLGVGRLFRTSVGPAVARAGVVVVALVAYRTALAVVDLPVALKGLTTVAGGVVVGAVVSAVALWRSEWPEVARVKTRILRLVG